jgi:hypothetical protein
MYHVTIRRKYRNVIGVAARRSGKSVISRLLVWAWGLDPRPGDIGYMAPTLGAAKRYLWRPLMQDYNLNPAARHLVRHINQSECTVEFVTGTRLTLFSADAYERVRGEGFKGFITDESGDANFKSEVYDEAIAPALSADQGQLVQLGTPKGKGRFYTEYLKGDLKNPKRLANYISCQVTAIEAGIIPREEIEEARSNRPARAFRQEYEASFENVGTYIYDEYNPNVHVIKPWQMPERFDEIAVGVDWGVAKRGVMLVVGIVYPKEQDEFGIVDDLPTIYVIEEHSADQVPYTSSGWWKTAEEIQKNWAPNYWIYDPAQTIDEYANKLKFVLNDWARQNSNRKPPKVMPANNAVRPGISTVQEFLHYSGYKGDRIESSTYSPPHLFIIEGKDGPRKCFYLRDMFPKYQWKRLRGAGDDAEPEEIPIKKSDHELDACRYICHTLFGHIRGHGSRRTEQGGGW